jgi:thymidylate kinase
MDFLVKLNKVNKTPGIENLFTLNVISGIQFENDVAQCNILIYFDVPDDVMTKRLVKRGETSGRIDDNEDTIKKRLKTFHEETTPILGYYGKQGKLVTIDANRHKEEVFTDVSNELDKLMEQHVGKHLAFVLFIYIYRQCTENFLRSIRLFSD